MVGPREHHIPGAAFYEDNASAHHLLDAIEIAQRAGVIVFCVRYTELRKGRWNARNKYGRAVMERIAKETGGLDPDATDSGDPKAQFRQIADILRASCDFEYNWSITPDGPFPKIQLLAKPSGLVFRHKTGHFARENEIQLTK